MSALSARLLDSLLAREHWLLHSAHHKDPAALEAALGEDLQEVAPNGVRVSRAEVIAWLLHKDDEARWVLDDVQMQVPGEGLVLLSYRARQVAGCGMKAASAGSCRTSLWRLGSGEPPIWQLCFHQATALSR